MSASPRFIVLVACSLVACGGGGGDDDPAVIDAPVAIDAPGAALPRIGVIEVIEDLYINPEPDGGGPPDAPRATVAARFLSSPDPRWHREVMRAGPCSLRTHTLASCTPACTQGLCVDTNVCERFPDYVSAGRLTVTGLRVPLQIDPRSNWYYPDGQLPPDLFADDATVAATLAGATLPAMSLSTPAVAPLTAAITRKVVIPYPATGDHVLRWTPVAGDARVRLTINANNRGHGLPPVAIIECDVPDADGQVTLPAAMLDAFPDTRAWTVCAGTDCPPSTLRRYRRGAATVNTDQEVELIVGSQLTFGVDHIVP